MDELRKYVDAVKRNFETMHAPDYEGRDEDLRKQQAELEKCEQFIKSKTISAKSFDELVDAAVECASNEKSFSKLEELYHQSTITHP